MRDSQGAKATFADLVSCYVAPLLSASGFRKSKLVWNRRRYEIIQVLDIQVSRWSDEEELRFTINLGVLAEETRPILCDKPMPRTVQEADCFPRLRISYLLDEGPLRRDTWWTITQMTNLDAMGIDLQGVLSTRCIPFLDKLDSIGAILALAEDPLLRRFPAELLSYAILKHLAGARQESQQILGNLLENKRLDAWHDCTREVRARLAKREQSHVEGRDIGK